MSGASNRTKGIAFLGGYLAANAIFWTIAALRSHNSKSKPSHTIVTFAAALTAMLAIAWIFNGIGNVRPVWFIFGTIGLSAVISRAALVIAGIASRLSPPR